MTGRPNIIYILTDDLGYGDLGCYGSTVNRTPNIDAMAAAGVRFTDFHTSAWCAPSRAGLMTGCHPNRPGIMDQDGARLAAATMIPAMLRERGYRTSLIGKWHLGMEDGKHPLDQGFDYWYGTRGSNDWDGPAPNYESFRKAPEDAWQTPLYIDREQAGIIPQSEFTRRYTDAALRLIKERGDQPFFIYLAHNMPHVPLFPAPAFRGRSRNGVYGDVIEELDWSTGEILRAVEDAGLSEETIVVFTSDNGPWTMFREFGGVATPLRGEKCTTWDGGDRVPAIFHCPGTIAPGVSGEFIVNTDMYATLAALTGGTVRNGHAIDSMDMSEVLLACARSPRMKHIFYYRQPMAYRNGKYKIHFLTRERTRDPLTGRHEPSIPCDSPLLFDMETDIAEAHDIAAQRPEIVERLTAEFEQARKAIENWEPIH